MTYSSCANDAGSAMLPSRSKPVGPSPLQITYAPLHASRSSWQFGAHGEVVVIVASIDNGEVTSAHMRQSEYHTEAVS